MKLAHVIGDEIISFPTPVEGFALVDCFHQDFVSALVEVPNNAQVGWVRSGSSWAAPPAPALNLTLDDYRRAIQAHVDATAQTQNYDSGLTCSSYVNSTNPAWAAQATAFVAWRDLVWAHAFTELAKVEAGTRQQPTVAEMIGELVPIEWPT